MSIPLDRLYHYIESIAQGVRKDNVVIYRFFPHGSKKAEDLTQLHCDYTFHDVALLPQIYCNDQEPLNYDNYPSGSGLEPFVKNMFADNNVTMPPDLNFRKNVLSIYDKCILLHSEKRSENLNKYQNRYWIPAYYWSHAIIARDWFRYAEHITQKKNVNQLFLVYNRAWSGTREYRLGFADQLIMKGLVKHVLMRVSPVDSTLNKHYDLHQFEHPHWRPHNVIEKYFPLCEAESHYSADFDQPDYESTEIEVVLETLFDDLRLHLTEKTLRPIAMGQPFILAGTYGSLKYLQEYGFKTFSDCWDESYDMMTDSIDRMNKITQIMEDIIVMPKDKKEEMLVRARSIAEYNKKHFFSDEFQNLVQNELSTNLDNALKELELTNTSRRYFEWRKSIPKTDAVRSFLLDYRKKLSRVEVAKIIAKAREYVNRADAQ